MIKMSTIIAAVAAAVTTATSTSTATTSVTGSWTMASAASKKFFHRANLIAKESNNYSRLAFSHGGVTAFSTNVRRVVNPPMIENVKTASNCAMQSRPLGPGNIMEFSHPFNSSNRPHYYFRQCPSLSGTYLTKLWFTSKTSSGKDHRETHTHNFHLPEDQLPWSPIVERQDTFSLRATSNGNNGMEGFRDAVRGSQGYIRPKESSSFPANELDILNGAEKQHQSQPETNSHAGSTAKPKAGVAKPAQSYIPRNTLSELITRNDKLLSKQKHDIENFRDGKEGTKYIREKGMMMGGAGSGGVKRNLQWDDEDGDVIVKSTSKVSGGSMEKRSGPQSENFRDGARMKTYQEEAFVASVDNDVVELAGDEDDDVEGVNIGAERIAFAEDDWVQFRNTRAADLDLATEKAIESESKAGKNVNDDGRENVPAATTTSQTRFRVSRDGPQSENFRDGARMATYQEKSFIIDKSAKADESMPPELNSQNLPLQRRRFREERIRHNENIRLNEEEHEFLVGGGEVIQKASSIGDGRQNAILDKKNSNYGGNFIMSTNKPDRSSTDNDISREDAASTLLTIDPTSIDIIPLDEFKADEELEELSLFNEEDSTYISQAHTGLFSKWVDASSGSFVKMFRGSASYIANHRGTLAVYHIPGELLAWEGFPGLMDDIALTLLLGMKIVLVAGCRHQIDIRLDGNEDDDEEHRTGGKVMMSSIRVTDEETLRVVKEEAGFVRFEIERRLARSLRLHGGLIKGSESLIGNVVSGNFYSAQPFGVLDGIDYCWTGFPRKVEIERIRQVHETNDIVLLTSLGVSPSGEIFNVNSEFLAASVAGALSASKIIYFNVHGTSFQNKYTKKPVQNLRVSDARNLLAHYKMRIHPKGFCLVDLDEDSPHQEALRAPGAMETLIKVGYSMVALEKGVKRAHILAPENGALVQELYTRDGCGTLISRDIYEGIRRADVNDVSGIYDLIDPLVRQGTLVERPKSQLEKEILSYYVYTRDGLIVATGQLKRFEGGFAEIGCLVVSKDYRRGGRGDAMLGYLERLSLQCGAKKVFVLSTQTMEWFVERGFREVQVGSLPPSRQAMYNVKRKSKIYMKEIDGDRDLDAAELWWSNR
mmetsp:Transcript_22926/g.45824  ORF Transcript_22926/g.45824 Transcript_22926/m.45824 type:complete len:1109 (-) Transcript_22926:128-3454(-)